MESPTRGFSPLAELSFVQELVNEQIVEDANSKLQKHYRRLYPEDLTLINYENFISTQIINFSKHELPEDCARNIDVLTYDEADEFVCLVHVIARYISILIRENANRFQKNQGITQDVVHFFTVHWANYHSVVQGLSGRLLDSNRISLLYSIWCDAFFTVSFDIPCAIIWVIERDDGIGYAHFPLQAYECYYVLGLIDRPHFHEFIVWHAKWNEDATKTLLCTETDDTAYQKPKTMLDFWKKIKNLDQIAKDKEIDMPILGGACSSKTIDMPTSYMPPTKKPRMMIDSSSFVVQNNLDEPISNFWKAISTKQIATMYIDIFHQVPMDIYFEKYLYPMLVPFMEHVYDWTNFRFYFKLVISDNNNSSNIIIFNSFPYHRLGYTPCLKFNWSTSICKNPFSFTCLGCGWPMQLLVRENKIRLYTPQRGRRHKAKCFKGLNEIVRHDMRRMACEFMRPRINAESDDNNKKVVVQLAYKKLDDNLSSSRNFLSSCYVLFSEDLYSKDSDRLNIRRTATEFHDNGTRRKNAPKKCRQNSQAKPIEKTPFRAIIEHIVYNMDGSFLV